MRALPFALLLVGCSGSFSIPPAPTIIDRPAAGGAEIIQSGGQTEIIEPQRPALTCMARARGFSGVVGMPCDLATLVRP